MTWVVTRTLTASITKLGFSCPKHVGRPWEGDRQVDPVTCWEEASHYTPARLLSLPPVRVAGWHLSQGTPPKTNPQFYGGQIKKGALSTENRGCQSRCQPPLPIIPGITCFNHRARAWHEMQGSGELVPPLRFRETLRLPVDAGVANPGLRAPKFPAYVPLWRTHAPQPPAGFLFRTTY